MTVVLIFPNLCLWQRSLRSSMVGIEAKYLLMQRNFKHVLLHGDQEISAKSSHMPSPPHRRS